MIEHEQRECEHDDGTATDVLPENERIAQARAICLAAHEGQVDRAGKPYASHPLHVASGAQGESQVIVALLHDVFEDTDRTLADNEFDFLHDDEREALDALTHRQGATYDDYLARVAESELASSVKLLDLAHNMQIERIPPEKRTSKDYERLEKYRRAVEFLESNVRRKQMKAFEQTRRRLCFDLGADPDRFGTSARNATSNGDLRAMAFSDRDVKHGI